MSVSLTAAYCVLVCVCIHLHLSHCLPGLSAGSRPERLAIFDEECWQLMEACWNGDALQRPLLGIVQPGLHSIMVRMCNLIERKSGSLDDSN